MLKEKLTLVVILEAVKGKEENLKKLLYEVMEPSRAEEHCLEWRLHQDKNNQTQFVLYENWASAELQKEQVTKPYVLEFGAQLKPLLAKPYQVICATEIL